MRLKTQTRVFFGVLPTSSFAADVVILLSSPGGDRFSLSSQPGKNQIINIMLHFSRKLKKGCSAGWNLMALSAQLGYMAY